MEKTVEVQRKVTGMTTFGRLIWKEMARKAGEVGIVNIIRHFAEDVVPLGEKTLRRRLGDDNWTFAELLQLQAYLKSDAVDEYLRRRFREVVES